MSIPVPGDTVTGFLSRAGPDLTRAVCGFALLELVRVCGLYPAARADVLGWSPETVAMDANLDTRSAEVNAIMRMVIAGELAEVIEQYRSERPNG